MAFNHSTSKMHLDILNMSIPMYANSLSLESFRSNDSMCFAFTSTQMSFTHDIQTQTPTFISIDDEIIEKSFSDPPSSEKKPNSDIEFQENLTVTENSSEELKEISEKSYKPERKTRPSAKSDKFDKNTFWSEDNITRLLELAAHLKRDWKKVAKKFAIKQVTPHFVSSKYNELKYNKLPSRKSFTQEEDLKLAKYFKKFGTDWDKVKEYFPTRSAMMLKNRYYSQIKKKNILDSLLEKGEAQETIEVTLHKGFQTAADGSGRVVISDENVEALPEKIKNQEEGFNFNLEFLNQASDDFKNFLTINFPKN